MVTYVENMAIQLLFLLPICPTKQNVCRSLFGRKGEIDFLAFVLVSRKEGGGKGRPRPQQQPARKITRAIHLGRIAALGGDQKEG